MKKGILFSFVLFACLSSFAQPSEVTNAIYSHKDNDLSTAKTSIDKAIIHEKTANEPKTWLYKGKIYESISNDPILGKQNTDAAKIAFEAYEKAKQLDQTSAKPGKYKKEIDEAISSPSLAIAIQNAGIVAYQNKNYDGAYNYFTMYQVVKSQDTLGYVYAAQMALAKDDYKKAKETYTRGIEKTGYTTPEMLTNLIFIYKNVESERDYAKALEVAQMGRSKYPGNTNFVIQEIDLLEKSGKLSDAIAKQETAIQKGFNSSEHYLILGSLYEKNNDLDKAKEAYGKSLAANPNSFEANYNLGALKFNPAVEILKVVRNMGVGDYNKKGKGMESNAKEILKESLPYFEKAYSIKPEDSGVKKTLKEIYTNLGMSDKANAIK